MYEIKNVFVLLLFLLTLSIDICTSTSTSEMRYGKRKQAPELQNINWFRVFFKGP